MIIIDSVDLQRRIGIVETEMAPVVDEPELIEFTFMLWIGQNRSETYALDLKVPVNTSLYEAMLLAAELDPNYQCVHISTVIDIRLG